MSGHIWASWAPTKHAGITHLGTFGHLGHLHNMRDAYVFARLGILDTHTKHQELHIWAHVGIRFARFVLVVHPWAPPWAP